MSGSIKLGLYILVAVVVGYFAITLVLGLFYKMIPILIMGALALVVFGIISRKALNGGRRTLP